MSSMYYRYPAINEGTITSINGQIGPSIDIDAGTGISIASAGNTITISATGSSGITSINSQTGPNITIAAGTGISIATTTNTVTITSTVSGANTSLSNLTSPTAINQNLIPSNNYNIGSALSQWNTIYLEQVDLVGGNNTPLLVHYAGNIALQLQSAYTLPDSTTSQAIFTDGGNNTSSPIGIVTVNATSGNTTGISIQTGNVTAGSGNSGNIDIRTGTSSGGSRGLIQFANGSEGTSGYVWTSSDASGSGAWQAPTPGFDFFASSQVTTQGSGVAGGSFTTFDNSPAFTFTPNYSGTYKIYANPSLYQGGAGATATVRIYNTSGGATSLYDSETAMYDASSLNIYPSYVQGVYTLVKGTVYVFDIQGNTTQTVYMRGDTAPFYMFAERVG